MFWFFKMNKQMFKPVPKNQPSLSFSLTPHGEGCTRRRDRECGRTMGRCRRNNVRRQ